MCITVFVHNMPANHDTRWISVLNPRTGYSVRNPFLNPQQGGLGPNHAPCAAFAKRQGQISCPWHHGCCALKRLSLCRFTGQRPCPGPEVKFHHVLEPGMMFDADGLREYLQYQPSFLPFIKKYFGLGTDMGSACAKNNRVLGQLALCQPTQVDLQMASGVAINYLALMSRSYHLQYLQLTAEAQLGQMARYWDAAARKGAFPERPGRETSVSLNIFNVSDTWFQGATWGRDDNGIVPWPNYGTAPAPVDNVALPPRHPILQPLLPSSESLLASHSLGKSSATPGQSVPVEEVSSPEPDSTRNATVPSVKDDQGVTNVSSPFPYTNLLEETDNSEFFGDPLLKFDCEMQLDGNAGDADNGNPALSAT